MLLPLLVLVRRSFLSCRWISLSPQDRSLYLLAQKFENQIFTAAMNVEDYTSRINKKLSKVQKVRAWFGFYLLLLLLLLQ